jgi:hypothetical protein|tara:strand:- start:1036 stop:1905 length:870 start_codon:yes stop_codon:yes gene_type:complete
MSNQDSPSKNLNTLVDDIYSNLESLSNGEGLDISEDLIEDFGEKMKDAIRNWSTPREDGPSVRMSNLGKPLRQLWYDVNRDDIPTSTDKALPIKFLYGHLLEEVVLLLVRMANHEVSDEQKEIKVDGVKGHIDCVIDGEVIDVKTASNFSFKKFQEGSLSEDDPFGYIAQLSGYEKAIGTNGGGFLALNKESGALCLYRPEEQHKVDIPEKIKQVKEALDKDTPPDRCFPPVPDGKSGNMRIARQCNYCIHKHECFKETNGGKGLRVFMYSNGPRYLTRVQNLPRVLEA